MGVSGDRVAIAVARLDSRDWQQIESAWGELRPLGFAVVPYLRDAYPAFSHWEGRTALVYHATRYARIADAAIELGLMALRDRSYMVRYRACGLLAYSLRDDCLEDLAALASSEKRALVRESAQAAIVAIRAGNHHLFVDSSRTGHSFWEVNPGDSKPHPGSMVAKIQSLFR